MKINVTKARRCAAGLTVFTLLWSGSVMIMAAPAQAESVLNFLKNLTGDNKTAKPAERNADQSAGKIGEQAVALVENIAGVKNAKVQFMDYVYKGQVIALGRGGTLKLAFMDSCRVETIRGGTITVAASKNGGGSLVKGGRMTTNATECVVQHANVSKTREAGATVERVTPFDGQAWSEKTIKSSRPIFKWPPGGTGRVTVEVIDIDRQNPRVIWRIRTRRSYVRYPSKAARLITGRPYAVRVTYSDGRPVMGLFSRDPWLEGRRTLSSNVVALAR